MVVGLIILGICILGSVALICFKGINVTYHKHFTVKDDRESGTVLTEEQLKLLEKDLNKQVKPTLTPEPEDIEPVAGPMDSVIGEIQNLFGPENEED